MRKLAICLAIFALALPAAAQLDDLGISLAYPREYGGQCNSAAVASGVTYFNADMIDTLNEGTSVFPVDNAWVYPSTNGGSSWLSRISMSNVGGTDYADTWQCSRTNGSSGSVEYYFKCETESTLTSECPDNESGSIPLAENYSTIFPDVSGDASGYDGYSYNTYDITNFWVSHDASNFYFRVTLAEGWQDTHEEGSWWPKTYWHMMVIPLLNNESDSRDSIFFAAVIGDLNILGIVDIWDGIYKITKPAEGEEFLDILDNYDRLADLPTSPSNPDGSSNISMRAPISTLTSNGWGTWPNEAVAFGTGCATATTWTEGLDSLGYVINDATKTGGVYCYTHSYTIGTNAAPTLDETVSHYANRDTTRFTLQCTYTDPDNNLPTPRQLEVDDGLSTTTYTMTTPDHVYDDGAVFSRELTYRCQYVDTLKYRWSFGDGDVSLGGTWQDYVVPEEISLTLSSDNWDVPGELSSSMTVQMTSGDGIGITNVGNLPLDLGLEVSDWPDSWVFADTMNWDTTAIYGYFDDAVDPPDFSSYDDTDVIFDRTFWATSTSFGPGGENISYCVDGANTEKLWMGFTVPRYYGETGDQTITVKLWAKRHMP